MAAKTPILSQPVPESPQPCSEEIFLPSLKEQIFGKASKSKAGRILSPW